MHSVHAGPCRIYKQSGLNNKQQCTTHGNAPKVHTTPPQHLSTRTKPLQIIKALTATGWGKQKETLIVTYKADMRPALEYASSIWSPLASSTSINKRPWKANNNDMNINIHTGNNYWYFYVFNMWPLKIICLQLLIDVVSFRIYVNWCAYHIV